MLENSPNLTNLIEKRTRTNVVPNKKNIKEFKRLLKNVQIIRSTELVIVSYKIGLLNDFIVKTDSIRNPRKRLLDAALWAVKVRGCSISGKEIKQIVNLEA